MFALCVMCFNLLHWELTFNIVFYSFISRFLSRLISHFPILRYSPSRPYSIPLFSHPPWVDETKAPRFIIRILAIGDPKLLQLKQFVLMQSSINRLLIAFLLIYRQFYLLNLSLYTANFKFLLVFNILFIILIII